MSIEIGITDELPQTSFAPLAFLLALYQRHNWFNPLLAVPLPGKIRQFSPHDKLLQLLTSILAGCRTLAEVNGQLGHESKLAQAGQWPHFADQSTLSRTCDALTQMQLDQIQTAVIQIWQMTRLSRHHDWRAYLWIDFDLSGLPCSARAQASHRGYFGGKKTSPAANWRVRASLTTRKRSGPDSIRAIAIRYVVWSRRCWPPKLL